MKAIETNWCGSEITVRGQFNSGNTYTEQVLIWYKSN